jgi:hypothetical protein
VASDQNYVARHSRRLVMDDEPVDPVEEVVAIAIRAEFVRMSTEDRPPPRPWDRISEHQRKQYRKEARAAIAAFRKATGGQHV